MDCKLLGYPMAWQGLDLHFPFTSVYVQHEVQLSLNGIRMLMIL